MQQDRDVMNSLRTDLADLTALHAPSGAEQPVIARMRGLLAPLADTVDVDHMGNLTATREGAQGVPHIVVSAHADEIGAMVASVEPGGFLRLLPLGGVQPRLLEGRAVWVAGQPGVIGARSGHLTPKSEHGQGTSMADLYVDLGVDDAAAVADLGVRVGDPVVVLSELRNLAGTRVAGKGIDNRASCVVLLHLLRRLQGHELSCRLTALVTVQEEVGLRGATAAFTRLKPDLAIVIDTFPAAGTPDTRGMAYTARIGNGVLITPASGSGDSGFLFPKAAREAMIAAAQRAGVPYQLAVTGGGMTDAAAAHLAAGGIATLEVKIPRRYSHSPVEMLDLRDLAAALSLVEELVLHPPTTAELSFLGDQHP
ncbi:MAG TPA: M20/M25/M40 family metallo-hydrolase [Ktedonobacteraceae bacterium]|nr:M20/M25/M40 family metallo-hydrolase [Ktedonobacteraceae bacterium]